MKSMILYPKIKAVSMSNGADHEILLYRRGKFGYNPMDV